MIESIHIKNLQSHKETLIEFVHGVNVITGTSRNGKTTILRGLRKVIENRPVLGVESWIHKHNPKNIIEIEVKTSEGHSIGWKNTSPQTYWLDDELFRGFGQNVPAPISKTLNISDLNTQYQFDSPFMLGKDWTGGEIARYLNQIVHLDKIDTSLANINSRKRQNSSDIGIQLTKQKDIQTQIDAFPDLESAESFIADLEETQSALENTRVHQMILGQTIDQIKDVDSQLQQIVIPDGLIEAIQLAEVKYGELQQQIYTEGYLNNILTTINNIDTNLTVLKPIVSLGDKVIETEEYWNNLKETWIKRDLIENTMNSILLIDHELEQLKVVLSLKDKVDTIGQKSLLLKEQANKKKILIAILNTLEENQNDILAIQRTIKKSEEVYKESFPATCPLCERPI